MYIYVHSHTHTLTYIFIHTRVYTYTFICNTSLLTSPPLFGPREGEGPGFFPRIFDGVPVSFPTPNSASAKCRALVRRIRSSFLHFKVAACCLVLLSWLTNLCEVSLSCAVSRASSLRDAKSPANF